MSDCGNVQKVFVPSSEEELKKTAEKKIQGIQITDLAAEKIKHFIEVDGKKQGDYGLRISVVKDGCSGSSYTMDLKEVLSCQDNGDKIFEHNDARAIIDKLSYMFLIGSVLDYQESLLASGFQIQNPNITGSCSCGSSISFK